MWFDIWEALQGGRQYARACHAAPCEGNIMDDMWHIVTAVVHVNNKGRFPFQVGPTKIGEALGVMRLGGHREVVVSTRVNTS